jgi:hypothetical protein
MVLGSGGGGRGGVLLLLLPVVGGGLVGVLPAAGVGYSE